MHRNVTRVVAAGRALGVDVVPIEFPQSTRTAAEAADAIGVALGQIVKSLVFSVDERPVMALVRGDRQLSEAKLAAMAGASNATRPDADAVRTATGYPVGGVPPFGHASALAVYIDEGLLAFEEVWAAAGTPHVNFAIDPQALVAATSGRVGDITR